MELFSFIEKCKVYLEVKLKNGQNERSIWGLEELSRRHPKLTMDTVTFSYELKEQVERWIYRGEGNAHLALSLPDSKRILRIKKNNELRNTSMFQWIWQKLFLWNYNDTSLLDIMFYKNIMMPFFGTFIDDVMLTIITPEEIERLEENLQDFRPVHRRHKSLKINNAALFNDYVYLKSTICNSEGSHYAIEIKPKRGVPLSNVCHFCLKQEYKLLRGDIEKVTQYCPMDLFSGNSDNMNKALNGLIENPQNNLQVFKDGHLVYGNNFPKCGFYELLQEIFNISDSNLLINKFISFTRAALLKEFTQKTDHDCKLKTGINMSRDCVLGTILTLQNCDAITSTVISKVEGREFAYVEKYLEDVSKDVNHCPKCVMHAYCTEKQDLLDELQRKHFKEYSKNYDLNLENLANSHIEKTFMMTKEMFDNLSETQKNIFFICHYVAKIANDCSMMITFKKLTELSEELPKEHIIETDGFYLVFDVKVFDLYPKPHKNK